MTVLSDVLWNENDDLYRKIVEMPFNMELCDGTLSPAAFRHYIIQDAHYLEGFARALALAAARERWLGEFGQRG